MKRPVKKRKRKFRSLYEKLEANDSKTINVLNKVLSAEIDAKGIWIESANIFGMIDELVQVVNQK